MTATAVNPLTNQVKPELEADLDSVILPIVLRLAPAIAMTDDQFFEFCQNNQHLNLERSANQEILIMAPTGTISGHSSSSLNAQLYVWAEQDGTGLTFDSNTGFTFPNGAVRSPDAAWLKGDRWQSLTEEQREKFAPIVPDFVIELRSRTDSLPILQTKMQEYIAQGVRLAWLIDPKRRVVSIYRPQMTVEDLENPTLVKDEEVLPGFQLDLAKIW